MIEYLLSLISGFCLGFLIERLDRKDGSKDRSGKVLSKGMTASLFLLIFFLGLDIGRRLNLAEIIQVGKLSIAFAITTMIFSYIFSKMLLRGFGCSSR